MSIGQAFFDTNVLLYMHSEADLVKQALATDLLRRYEDSGNAILSTQVIQEFYARSRKLGMARENMREVVNQFLRLHLVVNGPNEIRSAFRIEERYQISFWDALIVAAAESAGAEVLFTEDLNDGQQYGSVLARNPFLTPEA